MSRVVVALGGNALNRAGGDGSWGEAVTQMRRTAASLAEIAREGHDLVVTHGNGPQVGALLRQNELAAREVPPRPMDVLGAQSEGEIGYLIQQEIERALRARRLPHTVLAVLGRMEVDRKDPAFRRPTKPIGRFYSESEARLLKKREGWVLEFDGARGGWRRLVASPEPIRWLEGEVVRSLLRRLRGPKWIPVVAGGGGVPVVRHRDRSYSGVEAVIDKDRAAALIGATLDADVLAIVTDVSAVAVGFGKPWERWLGETTRSDLQRYLDAGEFGEGSMRPKVEAALRFLAKSGRRIVITDAPSLLRAMRGETGTRSAS